MNYRRVVRAVCIVTGAYFLVLAAWLGYVVRLLPADTIGAQLMCILATFGGALGLALLWARRPSHADRKLYRKGYEGWAEVEHVRPLHRTANFGELAELDLKMTIPGSEPYAGTVVHEVHYNEEEVFVPGAIISVRVDPRDRDHIMLCP